MTIVRGILLLMCGLLAGCGNDQQLKVFERETSPNGEWLAKAIDEWNSGPGNAAHFIKVTIEGKGGAVLNGGPQDILILDLGAETYPGNPASHVSLHWQSPTRLQIVYRSAVPQFLVTRIAGVDVIAVQG